MSVNVLTWRGAEIERCRWMQAMGVGVLPYPSNSRQVPRSVTVVDVSNSSAMLWFAGAYLEVLARVILLSTYDRGNRKRSRGSWMIVVRKRDIRGACPDRTKTGQAVEEARVDLLPHRPIDWIIRVLFAVKIDNVTSTPTPSALVRSSCRGRGVAGECRRGAARFGA